MKTIQSNIKKAKKYLDNDDCIAVPTETVYGLAGNAYSNKAVKKIFKLKKRPSNNPLIIHYSNINDALNDIVADTRAIELANKFWPGPLTLVAKVKNKTICKSALSRINTVAVRVPSNIIFLNILNKLNIPLAAPSANLSNRVRASAVEPANPAITPLLSIFLTFLALLFKTVLPKLT